MCLLDRGGGGGRLQRAAVVLGGVLVGQRAGGVVAGADGVAHGVLRAADLARREELVRELAGACAERLERPRDAQVQPHAARARQTAVDRVAGERVAEREAVDATGDLDHEARRDRLLERLDDVVGRQVEERLDRREVELAADRGADRQCLDRRRGHVAQAAEDDVGDALGNADRLQRGGGRLRPGLQDVGVQQRAQRLLDEERVALGLLAQAAHEAGARRGGQPGRDERVGLGLGQAVEGDAVEALLAVKVPDELHRGVV